MPVSKFKATCLAVLARVRQSGRPVRLTKRGRPLADVVPPVERAVRPFVGHMAGTVTILGDVISPAGDARDWEALG